MITASEFIDRIKGPMAVEGYLPKGRVFWRQVEDRRFGVHLKILDTGDLWINLDFHLVTLRRQGTGILPPLEYTSVVSGSFPTYRRSRKEPARWNHDRAEWRIRKEFEIDPVIEKIMTFIRTNGPKLFEWPEIYVLPDLGDPPWLKQADSP